MRSEKIILLAALLFFWIGLFFVVPMTVQAGNGVVLPTGTGLAESTVAEILTKLLNWLLEIVGIIAIIGFVASGIMYLVSAGDEEMIKNAKKYMTYCIVGIVVVLGSFAVVKTIDTILKAGGSSSSSSDSYNEAASMFQTQNDAQNNSMSPSSNNDDDSMSQSQYDAENNSSAQATNASEASAAAEASSGFGIEGAPANISTDPTNSGTSGSSEPTIEPVPAHSSTNGVDPNLDPGI